MLLRLALVVATLANWPTSIGYSQDDDTYESLKPTDVLVTVNQQSITRGDLEFELLWRRVPPELQPAVRRQFTEELVDRKLLREFLEQRRVDVPDELLDQQIEQLRQRAIEADGGFDGILERLGFTEESLRAHLELPLAWRIHLGRVVTDGQLQEFFTERRVQFDGTRVRASQIVISVPGDALDEEWRVAEQTLQQVRRDIVAGTLEFADAAREFSTSPSRQNGGDLGLVAFHGKLPASLALVVFDLELNEPSQPVRSQFGVHLLMITERIPGDLNLEDVRADVLDQLSRRLWDDEAARLREAADVEWMIDAQLLAPRPPA